MLCLVQAVLVKFVALAGICSGFSPEQETDEPQRTLALLLAQAADLTGSVHALYATESEAGQFAVGYEFSSDAWYWINQQVARGQTRDGRLYRGDTGLGRLREVSPTPGEGELLDYRIGLSVAVPAILLRYLHDNPERILNVRRLDGSRLRVEYTYPQTVSDLVWDCYIDIANDGFIVQKSMQTGDQSRFHNYERSDRSPPELHVNDNLGADPGPRAFRLVSASYHHRTDFNRFEPAAIEALGAEIKLASERAIAAMSRSSEEESTAAQRPSPVPNENSGSQPGARFARPLIITGIILLVVIVIYKVTKK